MRIVINGLEFNVPEALGFNYNQNDDLLIIITQKEVIVPEAKVQKLPPVQKPKPKSIKPKKAKKKRTPLILKEPSTQSYHKDAVIDRVLSELSNVEAITPRALNNLVLGQEASTEQKKWLRTVMEELIDDKQVVGVGNPGTYVYKLAK